jgi:thiamine-phosphate pyrophosphorylase
MELIVISNPVAVANEAAIINGLFAAGLSRFHLRKPGYDTEQIRELLSFIDKKYYSCIALHQHHEMAKGFGINRLHYTEQKRAETTAAFRQSQKESRYILSTSIHELDMLADLNVFDYVFYGPVFNSLSKPGYQSKLPPAFRLSKKHALPKVIALGGIARSNLQQVKKKQFDGAALLGAIWNTPEQAIENFKQMNHD